MKTQFFKRTLGAIALIMLCCLFSNQTLAQTSVTIRVNPKPAGTISTTDTDVKVNAGKNYICNGSTVDFDLATATTPAGVINLDTKQWKVYEADGVTPSANATVANPTITGANITFTNATNTAIDDLIVRAYFVTDKGCNDSTDYHIIVNPTPVMTISGTIAATVCANTTYSLSADNVTNGQFVSWTTVNPSSASVSAAFSPDGTTNPATVTFTNTGTTAASITVRLSYVDATGVCSGVTYTVDKVIVVEPVPNLDITIGGVVATTASVCSDGTLDFGTDATTAANATFVSWTIATSSSSVTTAFVSSSSLTNPASIKFTNTGTTNGSATITINYVSTNAVCGSTTLTENVVITVYPQIVPVLTATAESCATSTGATEEMTVNVKLSGGCPSATGYTVTLSYPNGTTISGGQSGVTDNGNGTVTVTVTGAEAAGTGKNVKINIPTNGQDYTIDVTEVTQTGDPCGCTWRP